MEPSERFTISSVYPLEKGAADQIRKVGARNTVHISINIMQTLKPLQDYIEAFLVRVAIAAHIHHGIVQ